MAEETKIETIATEAKTRRSAIKTAAQVAVTAPAVGLLLSASTKSAMADVPYGPSDTINNGDAGLGSPSGDDSVSGDHGF